MNDETTAVPTTARVPARCDLCQFSRKTRANALDIQGHLLCVRLPPVAIMMPAPGRQGMMHLASAHPPVSPTMMCYEFAHDPAKVLEVGPAANSSGN